MSKIERIDYTNCDLDDVAVSDVELFRMERMAGGMFWIRLYRSRDKDIVFCINAVDNKIVAEQMKDIDDWKEPNKK